MHGQDGYVASSRPCIVCCLDPGSKVDLPLAIQVKKLVVMASGGLWPFKIWPSSWRHGEWAHCVLLF